MNIYWKIEKFDIKGNIIDSLTFKTNLEETGESLMRLNLDFDIASLYLPKLKKQYSPLRVIDSRCAIGPGTKVGWAGFPMFAEIKIQRKNPCYFEGVISTTVEDNGKLFYLVDGHGGKGISGGPLWYWNEEESNYEIIGVCNQYVLADDNYLPGLVSFQSINPLISYLKVDNVMDINEIIAEEFPRN